MERVRELIDKLWKQYQQQEGPEQLLNTVQHLQEQLSVIVRKEQAPVAGKVSVVMPPKRRTTTVSVSATPSPPPVTPVAEPPAPVVPTPAPAAEPIAKAPEFNLLAEPAIPEADQPYLPKVVPSTETPQAKEPTDIPHLPEVPLEEPSKSPYVLQKPVFPEFVQPVPAPVVAEVPEAEPPVAAPQPVALPAEEVREVYHLHFETTDEAPTLTQQYGQQPKELHELIGENKESLNDRLKQDRPELGNKLKEAPIRDLRKAIGVNDKFLFIKELFRGDEAMYERSIKTINNFHILPEAEYWISRELKVKLGWDDSRDTVQSFYQLVKRRFS